MRPIILHAKASEVIRSFPRNIRDRPGKALFLLQIGEQPGMPLSRLLLLIAPGVAEVRLQSRSGQFRTFYFAANPQGILVFHAFVKKTQQTPETENDES